MKNLIQHDDLSKPVYTRLKQMISSGKLKPGEKLVQEKLAAALGVSRTPVLKALQSLEHEMLVESIPRRGMYVKQVSKEEMINIYECREALECMAVKLVIKRASEKELLQLKKVFEPFLSDEKINVKAYKRADEKFHDMLIDLAQNPVLKKMSSVSHIHKDVYKMGLLRPPEETLVEHMRIVEAILNRDIEKATQEMRTHIELSKSKLMV